MPRRPNIIFIVTDQQRHDSLGCTGNPFALTPHLDALAREALLARQCFTTTSICMPSRASLLTGLYPSAHGVWYNGVPLPRAGYVPTLDDSAMIRPQHPARGPVPSHIPTLPDLLADAGYRTLSVGKLHLTPTHTPASSGFEESTQRWSTDPAMEHWHGPYYGFQHVELTTGQGETCGGHYGAWLRRTHPNAPAACRAAATGPKPTALHDAYPGGLPIAAHPTTWIAHTAADLIRAHATGQQPFFLWVGFPDPHHPFTPPAELAREYATHDYLPPIRTDWRNRPTAYRAIAEGPDSMAVPPDAIPTIRRYTDAMIHLIDRGVGHILEALRAAGVYDDTIIVFTSDHGDWLGECGLAYKFTLADDALNHVPLLIKAPALQPGPFAGAVSHTDLLPTICQMLDLQMPPNVQGQSLLEQLASDRDASRPVLTQHYCPFPQHNNFTLWDQRYRYTLYPLTGERELYDHLEDPAEQENLASAPPYAGVQAAMHQALLEAHLRTDLRNAGRVAVW